jgi:hypothetical protein
VAEHSSIPPSSAARRLQCSASTTAEAAYPQTEDSPESAAGTAAHWGVAEMLSGRLVDVGQIAPNGVFLTAEMVEAADLTYNDVHRELVPFGKVPSDGQVEQRVAIPRVHPQSWGTPDYYVWTTPTTLLLYDFKFGHRTVEVFENAQLIEYVAGVLDQGPHDLTVRVTVKIVQPRSFHRDGPIRAWTFDASDIRGHINLSRMAAENALVPNPVARVGVECRDCKARHACTVLQHAALAACDVSGAAQPFDLPPDALALEYRTLRRCAALLSARISGLEEQAMALGKRGVPLPGLRIEHGAGRERWSLPDAEVIAMAQMLGVNVAKPPEAMTPKQAVKAGLPPAVLPGLVNTPRGEAKLVDDDGSLARRVFA